jgi:hypothetical protein
LGALTSRDCTSSGIDMNIPPGFDAGSLRAVPSRRPSQHMPESANDASGIEQTR